MRIYHQESPHRGQRHPGRGGAKCMLSRSEESDFLRLHNDYLNALIPQFFQWLNSLEFMFDALSLIGLYSDWPRSPT
ncbi:hypothetical protein ACFFXZ_02335 [Massilia antarctica]